MLYGLAKSLFSTEMGFSKLALLYVNSKWHTSGYMSYLENSSESSDSNLMTVARSAIPYSKTRGEERQIGTPTDRQTDKQTGKATR